MADKHTNAKMNAIWGDYNKKSPYNMKLHTAGDAALPDNDDMKGLPVRR